MIWRASPTSTPRSATTALTASRRRRRTPGPTTSTPSSSTKGEKVLDRRELAVGSLAGEEAQLSPDLTPKSIDGTTVSLGVPETIRAGEPVHLDFELTEDREPVTDLFPYLGAAAHVAIVSEDGEDFAHGHGEAKEAEGEAHGGEGHEEGEAHALPESFGPGVHADHTFESPGLYKLWAQFERDGRVLTAPFVVEVKP